MKKILIAFCVLFLQTNIYAHSIIMNVFDNDDGTISIEGVFNTGESAQGALVKFEAVNGGEVLFQKRLPDEGELVVDIPKVKYKIVLDGGSGHKVVKHGIAPEEGFIEEERKEVEGNDKKEKTNMKFSSSNAVTLSIVLAFLLLFAILFISIKNTNKILEKIRT